MLKKSVKVVKRKKKGADSWWLVVQRTREKKLYIFRNGPGKQLLTEFAGKTFNETRILRSP